MRNQVYASRRAYVAPVQATKHRRFKPILVLIAVIVLAKLTLFHGTSHVAADVKIHTAIVPTQSICLDVGHGGDDPGAQNGSLTEAAVNLRVAKLVQTALLAKGYGVYMTRTTDKALTNADRVNYCNAKRATILVAVHQNSYTDGGPDYSTALEYKPIDSELANTIAAAAGAELGLPVTPPMPFDDGMLMRATMPSIIIESLFISNDSEAHAMATGNSRINQQAQGIINGVTTYLQAYKPASSPPR